MTLTGPITEFRNAKAFKYASECLVAGDRVVGFITIGDSNIAQSGVGWYDGLVKGLDNKGFKSYSTGTWGAYINSGSNNSNGVYYTANSLGSGAIWSGFTNGAGATNSRIQITAAGFPSGLTPYCIGPLSPNGGPTAWNALESLFFGGTFNTGSNPAPGVQLRNNSDLKFQLSTTGQLRSFHWFVRGPSTGVYRFGARRENNGSNAYGTSTFNFNVLDTAAPAFGTTSAAYGVTYAALSYTADSARNLPIKALTLYQNSDITGPGVSLFTAFVAGATGLSGGYFVSPAIHMPSCSLRRMVDHTIGGTAGSDSVTNEWLDAYLQAQIDIVQSNAQSGGSTAGALVFFINSGRNDINDNNGSYNPVTLTYSATGASASAYQGFKNNAETLINRIMSRPPIRSWYDGKNVTFVLAPSQRVNVPFYVANGTAFNSVAGIAAAETGCTAMDRYRDAAFDIALESKYAPTVGVDVNELASAFEWPFILAGGGDANHLRGAYGYHIVAGRLVNKLVQAGYGYAGLSTSQWGSTPSQQDKPNYIDPQLRDVTIATDKGWEVPLNGITGTQYEVVVSSRGLASRITQSRDRTPPILTSPLFDQFGGTTYSGSDTEQLGGISYTTPYSVVLRFSSLDNYGVYNSFTGGGSTATEIGCTFATVAQGGTYPSFLRISKNPQFNSYNLTGDSVGLSGTVPYGTRYPLDLFLTHPDGLTSIQRYWLRTGI